MSESTDEFAVTYQATLDDLVNNNRLGSKRHLQAHLQACKDLGRDAEYSALAEHATSWSRALVERDQASVARVFAECRKSLEPGSNDREAQSTVALLKMGRFLEELHEAAPELRGQLADGILELRALQPDSQYFWSDELLDFVVRARPDEGVAALADRPPSRRLIEALHDVGRLDAERIAGIITHPRTTSDLLIQFMAHAPEHPATRPLIEAALEHIRSGATSTFSSLVMGRARSSDYPQERSEWRWDHLMRAIGAPHAFYETRPPTPPPTPPVDTAGTRLRGAVEAAEAAHGRGENVAPALAEVDRILGEGQQGDVASRWSYALMSEAILRLKLKRKPDNAQIKHMVGLLKCEDPVSRAGSVLRIYTVAAEAPQLFTMANLKALGKSVPKAKRQSLWGASSESQEKIAAGGYAVGGAAGALDLCVALLDSATLAVTGFVLETIAAKKG
ncbi:MAG: hypothetical protein KC486_04390 [Myxococcales bacterium]|nr:hypothetical protein [Myxococcales bacterium]